MRRANCDFDSPAAVLASISVRARSKSSSRGDYAGGGGCRPVLQCVTRVEQEDQDVSRRGGELRHGRRCPCRRRNAGDSLRHGEPDTHHSIHDVYLPSVPRRARQGRHRTRVHFPRASRVSMSAFDSHRPLTMTPAIRELFAMFVSGLASSRMRSARLPAATVPTVDCVPK
jgi:hypothetical protein